MDTVSSMDGTRIAWRRAGSGPPLLLVHGSTATWARWAPLLDRLQAAFTVYAMDRRGRGDSGDTPTYSIEREFEDVAAVADAAARDAAEPVSVLGHSFGAICAMEAALLTPQIRKLVLYEPPIPVGEALRDISRAYPSPESIERMQQLLDAGERERMLEVFFRDINGMPPAQYDALRSSPAWPARVALAHTLRRELLAVQGYRFDASRFAGLDIPALLLLGGESPPNFAQAIDEIAAALPQSRKVVLAGQRHVAMDTAPELFTGEVIAFLRPQPGAVPPGKT